MNHKYLMLLLACTAGAAHAQRVNKVQAPSWARPEHAAPAHAQARPAQDAQARAGGDVVFSEDFANGLAGNNGVGAWTIDGADSQWWVYTTTGPNGAYSVPAEKIESETDANGWMIFQADSGNTDWNADPPAIVGSPTPWDAGLVSPVMDLSATQFVRVEFQQSLRFCCQDSPHFLQVKTDGGNDWSTAATYPVVTAPVNEATGTLTTSVNISAAIQGNAGSVRIRFYHNSASGSSHYHWQIDDVKIIELFDLDLTIDGGGTSNWEASTATNYDSLNYTMYAYSQLHPMPLNVLVVNNGSQAQDGAIVNFTVDQNGGGNILDQDQAINLPGGLSQRVYVDPEFTPPAVEGTYDVSYSVTSVLGDTTVGNDSGTDQFKVDPFVYSRDGGTVADYETGPADGEYEMCNGFYVANEGNLYAIDVCLRSGGSPSPVGVPVVGVLKDGFDFEIEIAQTMEHTIASSELNGTNGTQVISLIFAEPQFLEANTDYHICFKHFGGAEVRMGLNGSSEPNSSFIFYEQDPDVGPEWFFTADMPMVRMNFNPSVGISESDRQNGIGMGQNIPNPANGMTTIPYDLQEAASLTFEVHDLSGKLVATQTIGKRGAGSHRLLFDTTNLGEGVYMYSLVADGTRLTKRMTVVR